MLYIGYGDGSLLGFTRARGIACVGSQTQVALRAQASAERLVLFQVGQALQSGQRSVATASIVSQPSWSWAQSLTVLPSGWGWPLTRIGRPS